MYYLILINEFILFSVSAKDLRANYTNIEIVNTYVNANPIKELSLT